jgi:hypothetical protein
VRRILVISKTPSERQSLSAHQAAEPHVRIPFYTTAPIPKKKRRQVAAYQSGDESPLST